jgi:hypothetical protein
MRPGYRIRSLRAQQTIATAKAIATIAHMLGKPSQWAPHHAPPDPGGLPSWWAFWSAVLVDAVRAAVRVGRRLEAAEADGDRPVI